MPGEFDLFKAVLLLFRFQIETPACGIFEITNIRWRHSEPLSEVYYTDRLVHYQQALQFVSLFVAHFRYRNREIGGKEG